MRTLSAQALAAIDDPVTLPGWLVEFETATPIRICSRGTIEALGNTFTGWGFWTAGFGTDGAASSGGALQIFDMDQSFSAVALAEQMGDARVRVWRFFGDAVALPEDAVLVFDGRVGSVSGGDARVINVALVQREASVLFSPRRRLTSADGFHALPAQNFVMTFNGEKYELQPDR